MISDNNKFEVGDLFKVVGDPSRNKFLMLCVVTRTYNDKFFDYVVLNANFEYKASIGETVKGVVNYHHKRPYSSFEKL